MQKSFFFDDEDGEARRFNSAIIFVAKCESCQLIAETLVELGIVCTPLHSLMNQRRRLASLSRFKSGLAKILVATDVASRGLDIPEVDLVVNYDLPQVSADYIHRVGRTARAGKEGCAISIVTQYDVERVHAIEEKIGKNLEELPGIEEKQALARMQRVSTAQRLAKLRLQENGFQDSVQTARKRKKKSRKLQQHYKEGDQNGSVQT
eukprot:gb/GECG01002032.1/.p1 GENE.gb/GECG01002032.1/~~gb/GECG01002032.1/.p1  ORF type:complete len:207 (+),score=24.91 gb/GECG01002032.1/:1-621(+)